MNGNHKEVAIISQSTEWVEQDLGNQNLRPASCQISSTVITWPKEEIEATYVRTRKLLNRRKVAEDW